MKTETIERTTTTITEADRAAAEERETGICPWCGFECIPDDEDSCPECGEPVDPT